MKKSWEGESSDEDDSDEGTTCTLTHNPTIRYPSQLKHSGITNGYHWRESEDADAIHKAIQEIEREIEEGKSEVQYTPNSTIIASAHGPVGQANFYRSAVGGTFRDPITPTSSTPSPPQ